MKYVRIVIILRCWRNESSNWFSPNIS